jgi:hypothetical protein
MRSPGGKGVGRPPWEVRWCGTPLCKAKWTPHRTRPIKTHKKIPSRAAMMEPGFEPEPPCFGIKGTPQRHPMCPMIRGKLFVRSILYASFWCEHCWCSCVWPMTCPPPCAMTDSEHLVTNAQYFIILLYSHLVAYPNASQNPDMTPNRC